jgi:hypothetical protein
VPVVDALAVSVASSVLTAGWYAITAWKASGTTLSPWAVRPLPVSVALAELLVV